MNGVFRSNHFQNVAFVNTNFLAVSFEGSHFKNVSFVNCNFNQVTFKNANMKNVYINSTNFNSVTFEDAMVETSLLENVNMMNVDVDTTTFDDVLVNGEHFNGVGKPKRNGIYISLDELFMFGKKKKEGKRNHYWSNNQTFNYILINFPKNIPLHIDDGWSDELFIWIRNSDVHRFNCCLWYNSLSLIQKLDDDN